MTSQDLGEDTAAESIATALADSQPSWITLPSRDEELPSELRLALDDFDAGERAAARAACAWLRTQAVAAHQTSRTRLLIAGCRVAGFYSLASAQVELSQRDRRRVGVAPVRVPATLITWIAKDRRAVIDGKLLLLHAAATARHAAELRPLQSSLSIPSTRRRRQCGASAMAFERRSKPGNPSGSGCRYNQRTSGYGLAAQARRGRRRPPRGTTGRADPA